MNFLVIFQSFQVGKNFGTQPEFMAHAIFNLSGQPVRRSERHTLWEEKVDLHPGHVACVAVPQAVELDARLRRGLGQNPDNSRFGFRVALVH